MHNTHIFWSLYVISPTFKWPNDMTLVKEHVVILVVKTSQKSSEVYICVDSKWAKLLYRPFGVEVGYAMTFHKIQGRTINHIILDVNKRDFPPHITFNSLLVGLSRVKSGKDL